MDIVELAKELTGLVGGAMFALIIGIVAILIGKRYLPFGSFSKKQRDGITIIGATFVIAALLAMGIFGSGATNTPTTVESPATFDLTITSPDPEISIDAATHDVTWAINFNDTSGSFNCGTGVAELNITFLRTDANPADAIATAKVGTIPQITSTTGNTYDFVTKTTSGQYNAVFTNPNGAQSYMSGTVLVEGGSSNYLTLNITLNSNAVAQMQTYGTAHLTVTAGGHNVDITLLKATVTT